MNNVTKVDVTDKDFIILTDSNGNELTTIELFRDDYGYGLVIEVTSYSTTNRQNGTARVSIKSETKG